MGFAIKIHYFHIDSGWLAKFQSEKKLNVSALENTVTVAEKIKNIVQLIKGHAKEWIPQKLSLKTVKFKLFLFLMHIVINKKVQKKEDWSL